MPVARRAASAWLSKPACLTVLLVTGDRSQPDRSQPAFAQPTSDQAASVQAASALHSQQNLHRHLYHYARDRRIVKTDEFSSVFRLRPTHRTDHFVLYTRNNGLATARLGIVVAKRLAPRAVTRNMVKRITRELFRQSALPAVDCIVRLSKPINSRSDPAASSRLKKSLRSELQRLLTGLRRQDISR